VKLLEDWGVTVNKDLVLDLSGWGNLRLPPEVPMWCCSYESHPITQPLTRAAYGVSAVTRSLTIKSGGKTSRLQAIRHHRR
jgi:ABC-type uncharacterized transport system involved in gliding motility auxiliary subunit